MPCSRQTDFQSLAKHEYVPCWLQGEVAEKDAKAVDQAVSSCDGVVAKLQTDLDGLASEADELRAFGNEALGENERLQKENEDLRKSCEDAQLDQ